MAADRGTRDGDNSVEESTDITDGRHSPPKGMCKKNGMIHPCHCNGKTCKPGDTKRSQTPKEAGRLNGLSPKTAQNFSIPTLRSRAPAHNNGSLRSEKTSAFHESPGKRRRSLRGSKQECDDRHSPMGPISDHSIESKSDSGSDHLVDTTSALCSQHTDICSSVQSTLLGPISPDTCRSCTPPLSSGSTHSASTSCGGSATSLLNSVNACPSATPGELGGELMDIGGDGQESNTDAQVTSNHHSSSASSTTSSASDEVSAGKLCNGALFSDRNSLCSLFPAAPNRTALCTASTSANGCIRFAASSSYSSKFGRSSSSSSNGSSKPASDSATCHWANCSSTVQAGDLMDHIRKAHVEPQFQKPAKDSSESKKYVCLWTGCKVYDKASSSQSWLQGHILTHSGDKPFQCIVDGCGLRFTSQGGLERHVNSHFNVGPQVKSCTSKGKDDTPSKLLKRKKQLRRRKSWLSKLSARMSRAAFYQYKYNT